MISVDIADRFLLLGACPPFERLTEAELLLVSRHVRRRSHASGDVILPGGPVAERLMVVVGGAALLDGLAVPPVFDARSTLFGLPVAGDYRAGPDGAETLSIARPHLFTIARECPDFIVGLAATAPEERA